MYYRGSTSKTKGVKSSCKPKDIVYCVPAENQYEKYLLIYAKKCMNKQGISCEEMYNTEWDTCVCGKDTLFLNPSLCYDCLKSRNRKCKLGSSNIFYYNTEFVCITHLYVSNNDIRSRCYYSGHFTQKELRSWLSDITYKELICKLTPLGGELVKDILVNIGVSLFEILDLNNVSNICSKLK